MTPPYVRKWRGTKEPLDEIEKGQWKSWLKTQHSKNEDHGIWSHHLIANRWGNNGKVTAFIFLSSKITAYGDYSHEILRHLLLGRKVMTNIDSILKKQGHYFADKGPSSQGYGFSSSHVWMWELVYKESWVPKNWCFWTVVLEKTLESPLDCKEIKPVILKEINPEYSLEGMMLKLKLQYFGHQMWRKDPDSGKDWRQEEKGMTQDEMAGWHHWLSGHEFV